MLTARHQVLEYIVLILFLIQLIQQRSIFSLTKLISFLLDSQEILHQILLSPRAPQGCSVMVVMGVLGRGLMLDLEQGRIYVFCYTLMLVQEELLSQLHGGPVLQTMFPNLK